MSLRLYFHFIRVMLVTQVLLDHGVVEDKMIFLCILAAPEGIMRVCSTYHRMKVVTSEIDIGIDERFVVVPGVGEFGDRYFCM